MKLLVNLECLQPPLTGIGHYTQQLSACLAMHPGLESFMGLYRSRWVDGAQLQDWPADASSGPPESGRSVTWELAQKARRRLRDVPGSYKLRHQLRERRFKAYTRGCDESVYWEPGLELMPFSGKRVATVYDLSHLSVPASHPAGRISHLTQQIDRTLRHADKLVTISYTMRRDIAAYSGIKEENITIVPPAAAPCFRPLDDTARAEVCQRLGLPRQFILSVGTLEPRKNLKRLVQAYSALPDTLRRQWPLVCIGAKGWNDSAIIREMQRLESRGELRRLGYVTQQDLPLITASAGLLAYPSLYEGFGMPVVEAMACGVPVLTSCNTAMHEITGDNAFLVEPNDVDSIREALLGALENPYARGRLGAKGIAQAARYDWQKSADSLIATLGELSSPI